MSATVLSIFRWSSQTLSILVPGHFATHLAAQALLCTLSEFVPGKVNHVWSPVVHQNQLIFQSTMVLRYMQVYISNLNAHLDAFGQSISDLVPYESIQKWYMSVICKTVQRKLTLPQSYSEHLPDQAFRAVPANIVKHCDFYDGKWSMLTT